MSSINAHGYVESHLIGAGVDRVVDSGHNTLSYDCANTIASLFSGSRASVPAKVVFATHSRSTSTDFHFDEGREQREADIIGSDMTKDIVALDTNPKITPCVPPEGDVPYVGSKVTFTAMTSNNEPLQYVYGYLLEDADGKVLATRKLDQPVGKPKGYAMQIAWTITFN